MSDQRNCPLIPTRFLGRTIACWDIERAEYGAVPTEAVSRFVEDLVGTGLAEWR